jgi:outer membrane protein OmpU
MLEALMPQRTFQNRKESIAGGVLAALLFWGTSAAAQEPQGLALEPYQVFVGEAQLSVGGAAGGAVFDNNLAGQPGASGVAKLMPRLHRDYDSGLSLALDATLAISDALSRGRYNGGFFEKIFGEARTGLGRVEVGVTDGAAYDLHVTGPKVDAQVSLDDPQTTFFRDPTTHRAAIDIFPLRSEIGASSNYAKFTYLSPALFGVQVGFSFTPNQSHQALPFLHAGPPVPDRQSDIWEGALRYSEDFGPVTLTGYGGVAEGRGEHKIPGQEGVSDLGAGLSLDYAVNDDLMLRAGGSFRQSNGFAFDIVQSHQQGTSHVIFTSASVTYGQWILGVEYGDGRAESDGLPRLGLHGGQASLGYALNGNWEISGGWQFLDYARPDGVFFNATPRLAMDAGFLHLSLHV